MRLCRFSFLAAMIAIAGPLHAETLRVMSFNIWGGGANEGKGIEETIAAIKAANPDIIGIQETRIEADPCTADSCPADGPSVAAAIAAALGYNYYDQTQKNEALWANAVISRYPLGKPSEHDLGVPVDVNGKTVWIFNIHHDDSPYQPYQLLDIPYGDAPFLKTAAAAEAAASETRGAAMDLLFGDMNAAKDADAVFVTGDFNEPGYLDWTPDAVANGSIPVAVVWPTTKRLADAGFVDSYRAVFPDPVKKPAYTWSPRSDEAATDDHPDRIDFVFARGKGLVVKDAAIVGEDGSRSDIKVAPWPSDHRATLAEVSF